VPLTGKVRVSKKARLLAPVVAFTATMVAQRILKSRYRKVTGDPVPEADDLRVTYVRALVWSTAIAVVTTVIEVSVVRAIDRAGATQAS